MRTASTTTKEIPGKSALKNSKYVMPSFSPKGSMEGRSDKFFYLRLTITNAVVVHLWYN